MQFALFWRLGVFQNEVDNRRGVRERMRVVSNALLDDYTPHHYSMTNHVALQGAIVMGTSTLYCRSSV
jgi:hypothetical protein